MSLNNYSNTLRVHRKRAGLRQRDVALFLGLDCADRISHWENGTAVPNIVNLFKLAILFKETPERLYQDLYRSIKESPAPQLASQVLQINAF